MSNSGGGGWRAYRPSRGKHKPVNATSSAAGGGQTGVGRHPSASQETSKDASPPLPSKIAPPVNAWASGPPVQKNQTASRGGGGGIFSSAAMSASSTRGRGGAPTSRATRARGRGGRPSHFQTPSSGSPNAGGAATANGEAKFADVAERHQAAIKRHLLDIYVSSSEEEEEEDDDDDESEGKGDAKAGKSQQILNSVMENFSQAAAHLRRFSEDGDDDDVEEEEDPNQSAAMRRTYQMLTSCLAGGGIVCLICISNVKKNDAVWTCQASCFSMFHLGCIQKWVKEGAYQQAAAATLSAAAFPTRDIPWQCPKCRFDYPKAKCPTRYFCYCGKEEDPKFSPWNLPHSCGELCEKFLAPDCGHRCLLLCHPGPCPPCPQTVRNVCFCGNAGSKLLRCGNRKWSCGKLCAKTLNCTEHRCKLPCHEGACPPCNKNSSRRCRCGREEALRPCSDPPFDCGQMCGKPFSCGHHVCERICHDGHDCGPCPLTNRRSCPCGKKEMSNVSCTAEIPGCGDTCEKLLKCGKHRCNERCHAGACATCRETADRKCRCGRHRKKIQCSDETEFHCQDKCQRMKDCERHQCKRKCCDGNCPPCENVCGRTLACGRHKCVSRCHVGRCYPCTVTKDLKCFCGFTVVTFPCGDRSAPTVPPRCVKPCRVPPNCHHPRRKAHRCHFGDCPLCVFVCEELLDGCDHRCDAVCHDNVAVEIVPTVKRAGPWEKAPEKRVEIVKKPCPPCPVPTPVVCVGEHDARQVPCSEVAPWSCGAICERRLSCGNHGCELVCHEVEYEGEAEEEREREEEFDYDPDAREEMTSSPTDPDFPPLAGLNCRECERPCAFPRPRGCAHPCAKGLCHPEGLCPPCQKIVKFRCHCKNMVKHMPCREINDGDADESLREANKSCGGACPKALTCGHSCTLVCHSGDCSDPSLCVARVTLKCGCKRIKKDFPCVEVQRKTASVACDAKCAEALAAKKAREVVEAAKKEEEERAKNARIAADFERSMKGPKRTRKHRTKSDSETGKGGWRDQLPSFKGCMIASAIIFGVTAVVAATIIGLRIEG